MCSTLFGTAVTIDAWGGAMREQKKEYVIFSVDFYGYATME